MKGFVGAWIILLFMLGMFSFMYIALNKAYTPIYTWSQTQITDASNQKTQSTLNILWFYWPLAILFSYIVYSIAKPSREKELWPV